MLQSVAKLLVIETRLCYWVVRMAARNTPRFRDKYKVYFMSYAGSGRTKFDSIKISIKHLFFHVISDNCSCHCYFCFNKSSCYKFMFLFLMNYK